MSCEQLVAQFGMDDDASGIFTIDELLRGPQIESGELDRLDHDDWLDLLDDIDSTCH